MCRNLPTSIVFGLIALIAIASVIVLQILPIITKKYNGGVVQVKVFLRYYNFVLNDNIDIENLCIFMHLLFSALFCWLEL